MGPNQAVALGPNQAGVLRRFLNGRRQRSPPRWPRETDRRCCAPLRAERPRACGWRSLSERGRHPPAPPVGLMLRLLERARNRSEFSRTRLVHCGSAASRFQDARDATDCGSPGRVAAVCPVSHERSFRRVGRSWDKASVLIHIGRGGTCRAGQPRPGIHESSANVTTIVAVTSCSPVSTGMSCAAEAANQPPLLRSVCAASSSARPTRSPS